MHFLRALGIVKTSFFRWGSNQQVHRMVGRKVQKRLERFFPCRASLWSESKGYDCHLSSKSLKYIATLGSGDSESLDSYIPADGHPAGFYKLYGVSIGGYNDLYGSMLLLGAESSKISTTQVYITSSMILVRTYVGNPLQWSRLMKYTGEILS